MAFTAQTFCYDFHGVLTGSSERPGASQWEWTSWITSRLHDVARKRELSCYCHLGGPDSHTDRFEEISGTTRGVQKEYLIDMTWYEAWDDWDLPCVAIEHENVWKVDAFLTDFWKLMMLRTRLRVGIGYAPSREGRAAYFDKLVKESKDHKWPISGDQEDRV